MYEGAQSLARQGFVDLSESEKRDFEVKLKILVYAPA